MPKKLFKETKVGQFLLKNHAVEVTRAAATIKINN